MLGTGYAGGHVPELSIVAICAQSLLFVCDMSVTSFCTGVLGGVPVLFFGAALASGSVPIRFFRVCFNAGYALVVFSKLWALPHALSGGMVPELGTRVHLGTRFANCLTSDIGNITTFCYAFVCIWVPVVPCTIGSGFTVCADIRLEHWRADPRGGLFRTGRRAHLAFAVPVRGLRGTRGADLCILVPEGKGVPVHLVARETLSCFLID